MAPEDTYPVRFSVDYPDRQLDRLSTAFRIFTVIPIAIVLASVGGYSASWTTGTAGARSVAIGGTGLLVLPSLLMIVFLNRVGIYLALMDDRYPSTDEQQSVHLDFPYPYSDGAPGLDRWLPIVKWFLAIPHYVALFFLYVGAFIAVVLAWFAILFTGRYPRGLFDFVEGVIRWHNRVVGYAFILVTDAYPQFTLQP
jgi:Domain of unknown function (DUF4389)